MSGLRAVGSTSRLASRPSRNGRPRLTRRLPQLRLAFFRWGDGSGKGGRPRRQPIAVQLAQELRQLRSATEPPPHSPVFRGLRGGSLQPTILAGIICGAARRAGIGKHVTTHTLRHTAATWLRQATGDARLVAEYLGHADLSTVHHYAHVAPAELDAAARAIDAHAGLSSFASAASSRPRHGAMPASHRAKAGRPSRAIP